MAFTSTIFMFLFLPVSLAGYYLIRPELKNLFLLMASLGFYAFGEPKMVFLLLLSTVVNYAAGRLIARRKQAEKSGRPWVALALIWNLGLLFYFKYLIFTVQSINALAGTQFILPSITLPLGISFFTFRCISYILDVSWDTVPAEKNWIKVALYISFFPQISMGPITKYHGFCSQLTDRPFDADVFGEGAKRIIIGLSKKLVLANGIAVMVDQIFSMTSGRTVLLAWLGALGYLLQLYYDFSGYSDMAIGIGKLFGFQTPENFNYPYMSRSIVEFWNRWHMTLGSWFKDYLYTPVFRKMMTVTKKDHKKLSMYQCDMIALFVTWLLTGLWHGSAWSYVGWGLYNFAFIALERTIDYYQKKRRKRLKLKKKPDSPYQIVLSHIYFFVVLIFSQVMFRTEKMSDYVGYLKDMFALGGNGFCDGWSLFLLKDNLLLFIVGLFFCFPVLKKLQVRVQGSICCRKVLTVVEPLFYVILFIVSISNMVVSSYNPFMYLNF